MRRAIEEYMDMRPSLARTELDNKSLQNIAEMLETSLQNKTRNPQEHEGPIAGELLDAASQGNAARCLEIMASPAFNGINDTDFSGQTALHHAARKGLGEVVFAILACRDFWPAAGGCWR